MRSIHTFLAALIFAATGCEKESDHPRLFKPAPTENIADVPTLLAQRNITPNDGGFKTVPVENGTAFLEVKNGVAIQFTYTAHEAGFRENNIQNILDAFGFSKSKATKVDGASMVTIYAIQTGSERYTLRATKGENGYSIYNFLRD